jgi:Protein of unknown function (DUF3667)
MRKRKKSVECANCHYSFDEVNNYCPNCGQENHTHKLPIKHFAVELAESLTHFDTKVFRTFKEMLLKPGLVVKNYNNNKRARYVPPIRIYIFMSFIFFFLITVLYSHSVEKNSVKMQEAFKKDFAMSNSEGGYINFGATTKVTPEIFHSLVMIEPLTSKRIDSTLAANHTNTNWINTHVLHTMIKVYKGETSIAQIYIKLIKYISYALLIFMPFFAFVLKVFYRSKHQYYSELLVFSIYFHTFIFAVLGLFLLFDKYIYSNKFIFFGFIIAALIYLAISLKRVFEESIIKTILKVTCISLVYIISLSFLIMMMFVGSLL